MPPAGENFEDFCVTTAWTTVRKPNQTLQKHDFGNKTMHSKHLISKISRLRRATLLQSPSNVQFITLFSLLIDKSVSNLQSDIALFLYTCTNRFLVLHCGCHTALRLGHVLFTSGYRALYTCTKRFLRIMVGKFTLRLDHG